LTLWEERAARNEALFREVNEHAEQLGQDWRAGGEPTRFVCECSDSACTETISVPLDVYEDVRSHPRRFLIRPGHEHGELEAVVARTDGYAVVEKSGAAGRVAEQTDPREGV
jgi:hypothetical protein